MRSSALPLRGVSLCHNVIVCGACIQVQEAMNRKTTPKKCAAGKENSRPCSGVWRRTCASLKMWQKKVKARRSKLRVLKQEGEELWRRYCELVERADADGMVSTANQLMDALENPGVKLFVDESTSVLPQP